MKRQVRNGFSLVEVAFALGIVSFCLVAIVGMLVVGLSSIATATDERAALILADSVLIDLRAALPPKPKPRAAAPADQRKSPQFGIPVPDAGDPPLTGHVVLLTEAGAVAAAPEQARFRFVVSLVPPSADSRKGTYVHIRGTWPAVADPANQMQAVETTTVLDRN